jgi:hypothetical protein
MTHQCVKIEELGAIVDLGPDAPARGDIESCPNCRALFHSYLAFVDAEPASASDPRRADADLAAFLQDRVAGTGARNAGADYPTRSFFFGDAWTRLWPRFAPVAAAVVLVVAVAVWSPWQETAPVLERGDATSSPALGDATFLGENIELSWEPHAGATSYVVVLYGSDFSELLRMAPVAQTAVVLPLSQLPDGAGPSLAWRVLALEGGDVIATSDPGYITLP